MGGIASIISKATASSSQNTAAAAGIGCGTVFATLGCLAVFGDCDLRTRFARIPRGCYAGKVVWVTGATSGIGKAFCHELARLGACLIISARREAVLNGMVAELLAVGAKSVDVVVVDLSAGAEECSRAAKAALDGHSGRMDMLINNAGVSTRASALEFEMKEVHYVMNLNFFAPVALAREVSPALLASKGTIINVSSISSWLPTPLRSTYTASKSALDRYFTSFTYENPDIHVLSLCPGSTVSNVSMNALNSAGEKWKKMDDSIANGLPAARVAERGLAAVAAGIKVAFVAQGKELVATRLAYYRPDLWAAVAPRAFAGYAQKLEEKEKEV